MGLGSGRESRRGVGTTGEQEATPELGLSPGAGRCFAHPTSNARPGVKPVPGAEVPLGSAGDTGGVKRGIR